MWWLVAIIGMGMLYDAYAKKKDHEIKIKQMELEQKQLELEMKKMKREDRLELIEHTPEEKK